MLRYSKLLGAFVISTLIAGGCSSRGGEDSLPGETVSKAQLRLASTGISADITTSPWGDNVGFNAQVVVANTGTQPTSTWEVELQFTNAAVTAGPWDGVATSSGSVVTLRPAPYNHTIYPGGTLTVSFNGAWSAYPHTNPVVIAVRRDVTTTGSGGASTGGASGLGGSGGTVNGGAAGSAASGNAVATSGGSGGSSGNNVAQDKTATASSSLSGNPASYGNDSSATTSWCASSSAVNEWWSVDLGAEYALTGTEVTWPQAGRIYQYVVGISNDGTNYSEVVNERSNTRTTQTQGDSFSAQGRYLRLQVTGLATSPATSACISDFKAFGTPVVSSGGGGATGTGSTIGGTTGTGTGSSDAGATSTSGGTEASGGTTSSTSSGGSTSGGATESGGTSSTGGGTTSDPTDRRRFTIRLPGGVRRQDAAVAADGGPLNIADRTQVLHDDGSYLADGRHLQLQSRHHRGWWLKMP